MSSQPSAEAMLQEFPRSRGIDRLFWPSPAPEGFYGQYWGGDVLLAANCRPELAALGDALQGMPVTVLALAGGGLPLKQAAAFGLLSPQQALAALAEAPQQGDERHLLVPQHLARAFGWSEGAVLGKWKVQVVVDKTLGLADSQAGQPAHAGKIQPAWIRRLVGAGRLWLGQALIFCLPAGVFGWTAAIWTLASLAFCTLLLALAWPYLPGGGWLKGTLVGGAVALLYAVCLTLGWLPMLVWLPAGLAAVLAGGVWMGLVFTGVRA